MMQVLAAERLLPLQRTFVTADELTNMRSMQQYCQRCCFEYNFRNIMACKYATILLKMLFKKIISEILSHPSMQQYC